MTRILYADNDYPDAGLERALFDAAGAELVLAQCRTEDDVIAQGKGCRAILLQYAPVTEKVLAALPDIGIVSRIGAGYDTVDTDACARRGIWVANSPDYGVGEVATHALALALASIRHVVAYNRDIGAGKWHFMSPGPMRRPTELTLGIVGLGRIGKRMAHISRDVFKRVVAFDPYLIDGDFPAYVRRVSKEELFRRSDIVSLHVPLNDETRGIVDARLLSLMRKGSYLVNTSRGAVVNLDDVLAAVDTGRLDGAALDVLPKEPPEADHPILRHPRVLLTPHAAFYSVEGERELRTKAAQNLIDWANTGRPRYVVVEGKN